MKCIYLHRGYIRLIKKIPKCASTDRGHWNKNSEQSANNRDRTEILLVRQFCCAFFERSPIFFFLFASFFAQSLSLRRLLHSVYTVPLRSHTNYKRDQCSHLGKTIDALIIGDFDRLLIKFMQTAQLTF